MRKTALALVAMLIAVAGVWFLVYRWANRPRTGGPAIAVDAGNAGAPKEVADPGTLAFTSAARMPRSASPAVARVNPYAVARNGICVPSHVPDEQEASRKKWEALLRDPFWQAIFSGVNPERFYLVKTWLPLHRYVTYWKTQNGQAVHWTGSKIFIPVGTRVFTDRRGDMYLCACGNQVAADLPPRLSGTVLPPEEEPPVAYLVPPEPEPFPEVPGELSGETSTPMAPLEVAPPLSNEPELIPPSPPIFLGGFLPQGGGPGPGSGPGTGPIPGSPKEPPLVPEPGTLSLILIGLGASSVARRRRK